MPERPSFSARALNFSIESDPSSIIFVTLWTYLSGTPLDFNRPVRVSVNPISVPLSVEGLLAKHSTAFRF